jgi:peptide/nickel transport system permease protein
MIRRALRFASTYRQATVGGAIFIVICLLCICAPLIAPYNPVHQDITNALLAPGAKHWLGTDNFGRDMFSRILYGGRPTLAIGGLTVLITLVLGIPIGLTAGYYGGRLDAILMRISEFGLVLPALVLAIAIVGVLGVGSRNVVIALGIVYTPMLARVARAAMLTQRSNHYVEAAVVGGEGDLRIITQQLLPNVLGPVTVQALLIFAFAILAEASLSFLGLGTQPPLPSWGRILADGTDFMPTAPWLVIFPGLAILLTLFSLNIFGDGLRDIWDPTFQAASRAGSEETAPDAA